MGVDLTDAVSALALGLQLLLQWPTLGYLAAGAAIGFVVGILPGLGGTAALAIMLPSVLPLSPLDGCVLLTAAAAVSTAAGDITSIVLGVPGEATAAAIVPDGHALARRGEGAFAAGAAITASTVGAIIGVVLLVALIPVAQPLLSQVQSPELAALAVLGIALLIPLSRANPLKGSLAGALGLSAATVGLDPSLGQPRFTFGQLTLWDGLGLLPVALGIYAVPEAIQILSATASPAAAAMSATAGVVRGFRRTFEHVGLVVRCSLLGAGIGALPGVGAAVSQWTAYAHAAQRSTNRDRFGTGEIEGVIAPAAATTATLGGALLPTLALGIPGSVSTSFLLGALIFKGITPGPAMLLPEQSGGHLMLVFALVWCVVLSSVAVAALSVVTLGGITRLATIRPSRLFPLVVMLVIVGTVGERRVVADLGVVLSLGILGHAFAVHGWPRAPFILGFVFGPLLERRFLLSYDVYGWSWLVRPGVVGLAVLAAAWVVATKRGQRDRGVSSLPGDAGRLPSSLHTDLGLAALCTAVAATGLYYSLELAPRAAFFPRLVLAITLALSSSLVGITAWRVVTHTTATVRRSEPWLAPVGWLAIFSVSSWLLGLVLGAGVSTALFSRLKARESWRATVATTAVVSLVAYVLVVYVQRASDEGRLMQLFF